MLRAIFLDDTREERSKRELDPSLLDHITWPQFLWDYLHRTGSPLATLQSGCRRRPPGLDSGPASNRLEGQQGAAGRMEEDMKGKEEGAHAIRSLGLASAWRSSGVPPAQVEHSDLPPASRAAILMELCNRLLGTGAVKRELDRRAECGHWVSGRSGVGGAFSMFTSEVRAVKAAAESDGAFT